MSKTSKIIAVISLLVVVSIFGCVMYHSQIVDAPQGPVDSPKGDDGPLLGATLLSVKQGGTGKATFTAYSLVTAGTTSTGAFQNVSGVGTSGQVLTSNGAGNLPTWQSASGAPADADYLVGTSNGSLSAEIVVGTSPGGELGGTWGTPTIDDSVAVSSWNLTTPTITTSVDHGTAGVRISDDADGAITFLSLGNGSGGLEDLTMNLDDTSNVITFSSSTSVGTINFSGMALQEAGIAVLNNDEIDASSELLAIMDDETGTGALAFATNPTFTGLTLDAVALMNENSEIKMDPALSADGKYAGITEVVTAGETIAFGDVVYLKAADSQWYLTDADADATAGAVRIAIAVTAGTDNNTFTIMTYGKIRADANFPALTVGAPVYISTTAGDVQVAQPSGTDDVIRMLGHANDGNEMMFTPSPDYITHT